MSRWLVGSSSSSRSGARDQRARQQHATLHAAGQPRECSLAIQSKAIEHFADALVQRPAMGRLDLRLHPRQRVRIDRIGMAEVVELRELRAEFAQPGGDDVEHRALRVGRALPVRAVAIAARRLRPATSPSSGFSSPDSSFSSVDFPAPLRPISAIRSPGSMARSTCSSSNGPPTL